MIRMNEKLKSNSGASMILALVLLLVCVMVSSVIVTAAASGSSRNVNRTIQQRDYLAVSSASELILDNLQDPGKLVGGTDIVIYGCQQYSNLTAETVTTSQNVTYTGYKILPPPAGTVEYYLVFGEGETFCEGSRQLAVDGDKTKFNGILAKVMEKATMEVFEKNRPYEETFTITVDGEGERLPEVKCEFSMNTNYNVTIKVYSENEKVDYSMVITMNAKIVEDYENGKDVPATCTHNIYYKTVNENNQWVEEPIKQETFHWETKCPTIEITWDEPEITKGVE